jgi:pimeloyl-ACP methyl ester carboxylesterase
MHRDIRGSELVGIEGCGHLAPGECSEPVVAATIEFLKAQPAPQGGEKMVAGGME